VTTGSADALEHPEYWTHGPTRRRVRHRSDDEASFWRGAAAERVAIVTRASAGSQMRRSVLSSTARRRAVLAQMIGARVLARSAYSQGCARSADLRCQSQGGEGFETRPGRALDHPGGHGAGGWQSAKLLMTAPRITRQDVPRVRTPIAT
jgi:hypothetical protein